MCSSARVNALALQDILGDVVTPSSGGQMHVVVDQPLTEVAHGRITCVALGCHVRSLGRDGTVAGAGLG